jgi:hypothetical protein
LERGVYPAAYQAMFQWYETKGFQNIFLHYINVASANREYLSHNVTILLAFNSVSTELDNKQLPAFLDRFTEFATSTFSGNDTKVSDAGFVDVEKVLDSCIDQFDFYAHNLITLAWILRCKSHLSKFQYESMLSNLYIQANSPLEDPDDSVDTVLWGQCHQKYDSNVFVDTIKGLVFKYTSNLHQVTLADALCFLQSTFPDKTEELGRIAKYHCYLLEKTI